MPEPAASHHGSVRTTTDSLAFLQLVLAKPPPAPRGMRSPTPLTVAAAAERYGVDTLFVGIDTFFSSRRIQLVHLASHHRIVATYGQRDFVEAGGLMSCHVTDDERIRGQAFEQPCTMHGRAKVQNARPCNMHEPCWHVTRDEPDAGGWHGWHVRAGTCQTMS